MAWNAQVPIDKEDHRKKLPTLERQDKRTSLIQTLIRKRNHRRAENK